MLDLLIKSSGIDIAGVVKNAEEFMLAFAKYMDDDRRKKQEIVDLLKSIESSVKNDFVDFKIGGTD